MIAAVLTRNSRPLAFFSRTLTVSERYHTAVEKKAEAITEAIRNVATLCTLEVNYVSEIGCFHVWEYHRHEINKDQIQR